MPRGKGLKLVYLLMFVFLLTAGCSPKDAITKFFTGIEAEAMEYGEGDPMPGSGGPSTPAASPPATVAPAPSAIPTVTTAPTPSAKPTATPAPTPSPKPLGDKLVALTFDDGPDNNFTPAVMDVLKEKGVKATFFVVGIQVVQYPKTMKRIVEEGHVIGNHSWDHKKMTTLSKDAMKQEIDKTNKAIEAAVGFTTPLFRAPYGTRSSDVNAVISQTGNTHVGWTVDTRDWAGTSPADMMATTKRQLKPGGIILMHSFGGKGGKLNNTLEFLPDLIDFLNKEGYSIVTVPELLDARNK